MPSPLRTQRISPEAEPLFKRALAIDEKALGRKHAQVANILSNLASLTLSQRNWTQAADY